MRKIIMMIMLLLLGLSMVVACGIKQNLPDGKRADQTEVSMMNQEDVKDDETTESDAESRLSEKNEEEGAYLDGFDESKRKDYYHTVFYDGEYYSMETGPSRTLNKPEIYVGEVLSSVSEGKKPKENFQTNESSIVGKKIYLSETDEDGIYIEGTDYVYEEQVTAYFRYEKGLYTWEELFSDSADEYLPVICYHSVLYEFEPLKEEKTLPKGFKAVGTIINAGKHFLEEESSSNEVDYLGCEIYANTEQPEVLYVRNQKGNYNRCIKDVNLNE